MTDDYTHFQKLRDERIGRHEDQRTAARLAANEWYHQRVALSRDAEFRDDAPTPDSVYEGYSHEQLHRMVSEGLSGEQIGEVSYAWSELANALNDFAGRLHDQAGRTDAVWQGGAAESAKAYVRDMGVWSDSLGRCAQLVSHQVSMQCEAARKAHGAMPEPRAFDVRAEIESWPSDPSTLPAAAPESLRRQQDGRDRKDEAVRVMNDYDRALRNTAERQPVFPSPPRLTHTPADLGTTVASSSPGSPGSPGSLGAPGSPGSLGSPGSSGGPSGSGIGSGPDPRGPGPAGGHASGAAPTPSPRPGPATGAPAAAAGPRGAGTPFMGMPGGRGRGDGDGDDEEHRTKYHLEDDADWFLGMERPVQPVLGVDPNSANNA